MEDFERLLSMRRMDRDMEKLEKLHRQPGPSQPSALGPRDPAGGRTPAPAPAASAPLTGNAAAPLGVANPSAAGAAPSARAAPPVSAPASPSTPVTGWSTGMEEAPRGAARPQGGAEAPPAAGSAQPPRAFEDQIRKILEQQEKPAAPLTGSQPTTPPSALQGRDGGGAPPGAGSGLSYQTQTYAQTAGEPEEASPETAEPLAPAAAPAAAPPPLPERRGASPRRASAPRPDQPSSLWDLFR
jgi:hypothetical protein